MTCGQNFEHDIFFEMLPEKFLCKFCQKKFCHTVGPRRCGVHRAHQMANPALGRSRVNLVSIN